MLTIVCQVTTIDGVTKWLASAGLVGTNVARQVGTCCGVGFLYICQRRPKRGTADEHGVYGGSRVLFSSPKRQPCQHQTHIYNRYHNKDYTPYFTQQPGVTIAM